MKLWILTITGESQQVEASTVRELYEACCRVYDSHRDEFRLVAKGRNLTSEDPNVTLESLGFVAEENIHFVRNLRGGCALTSTTTDLKQTTKTRILSTYNPTKDRSWCVVAQGLNILCRCAKGGSSWGACPTKITGGKFYYSLGLGNFELSKNIPIKFVCPACDNSNDNEILTFGFSGGANGCQYEVAAIEFVSEKSRYHSGYLNSHEFFSFAENPDGVKTTWKKLLIRTYESLQPTLSSAHDIREEITPVSALEQ